MLLDVDPVTDGRTKTSPLLTDAEKRALMLDARLTVSRTIAIADVRLMTSTDVGEQERWRELRGVATWLATGLASYSAVHLVPPPKRVGGWRGWLIRWLTPAVRAS